VIPKYIIPLLYWGGFSKNYKKRGDKKMSQEPDTKLTDNKPKKDTQSRSYIFVINNYSAKGFSPQQCEKILRSIPSMQYYIFSLEIGAENNTPHIQGYFHAKNPIRFSTLKNKLPGAHIEPAKSTSYENRNYIVKDGKWEHTAKAQTNTGTYFEWGTMPKPHKGKRSDLTILYNMIVEGMTNAEILRAKPDYLRYLSHIERTRQAIREEEFRNKWRDISCIYVYGETETGKTRSYMEKYGYENVYRITNYIGNAVWDGYRGQDVIIFEEFRSQILISEMLTWLEGYPNCSLRARYADKVACYTKVIIISNIPLEEQYPNIQEDSPPTWRAFLRRIQKVVHHKSKDEIITYNSVEEYFHRNEHFQPVTEPTPFDEPEPQQLTLQTDTDKMPFED